MKPSRLARLLCLLALPWIAGCRSFESDWNGAAIASESAPIPGTGRWIGTWGNTNNTHGGPLRAVVKSPDGTNYTARFHAVWGNHSGSFRTPLPGRWQGDAYRFAGSKRVFGFRIDTAGTLTERSLEATYSSSLDQGRFSLRRPANP
ncbi:MAG: hypothetical protein DVB31_09620 [Verrucomicrobia bacterium]|nr:MAG: hypothetical protein DVB31_09620 [Verrucomicrobiota bacterium]